MANINNLMLTSEFPSLYRVPLDKLKPLIRSSFIHEIKSTLDNTKIQYGSYGWRARIHESTQKIIDFFQQKGAIRSVSFALQANDSLQYLLIKIVLPNSIKVFTIDIVISPTGSPKCNVWKVF